MSCPLCSSLSLPATIHTDSFSVPVPASYVPLNEEFSHWNLLNPHSVKPVCARDLVPTGEFTTNEKQELVDRFHTSQFLGVTLV